MSHLLYLMFRCNGDVMENLDFGEVFGASKHTQNVYRPVCWITAKEINARHHGKNKNLEMVEREYVRTIYRFYIC